MPRVLVCVASFACACSGVVQQTGGSTDEAPCAPGATVGEPEPTPTAPAGTQSLSGDAPDSAELPSNAPRASCDPSSWHVMASRSGEGDSPTNLIDGLPATRWSTGRGQGPGQYVQISFGGWIALSRLTLTSGGGVAADYLRGYEVTASLDGVTFDRVLASGTQALPPQGGIQIIDFFPTALQALRIDSIQPSGNWWSIHELNVDCYGADSRYGDALRCDQSLDDGGAGGADDPGADALNPSHWSATASRSSDLAGSDAAFDGNLATTWSTGGPQTSTDWFQLDLGSTVCISSLWIDSPVGESANAFTVEVSADGTHYVQVAEGLRDDGPDVRFSPHSARFVRINQIGSGASNRWRIQELRAGS